MSVLAGVASHNGCPSGEVFSLEVYGSSKVPHYILGDVDLRKINSTKRRNGFSTMGSDVRTLNPAVEVDKKSSISIFP